MKQFPNTLLKYKVQHQKGKAEWRNSAESSKPVTLPRGQANCLE